MNFFCPPTDEARDARLMVGLMKARPEQKSHIEHYLFNTVPHELMEKGSLMKIREVGDVLGVSRQTVWRMVKGKRLRQVEILPGTFRIPKADVLALIQGRLPEGVS